jgi:hypothetical protein
MGYVKHNAHLDYIVTPTYVDHFGSYIAVYIKLVYELYSMNGITTLKKRAKGRLCLPFYVSPVLVHKEVMLDAQTRIVHWSVSFHL